MLISMPVAFCAPPSRTPCPLADDGPMPESGSRDPVNLPVSAEDLALADADVIWDLSFRHIYDRPNLRAVDWYSIQGETSW